MTKPRPVLVHMHNCDRGGKMVTIETCDFVRIYEDKDENMIDRFIKLRFEYIVDTSGLFNKGMSTNFKTLSYDDFMLLFGAYTEHDITKRFIEAQISKLGASGNNHLKKEVIQKLSAETFQMIDSTKSFIRMSIEDVDGSRVYFKNLLMNVDLNKTLVTRGRKQRYDRVPGIQIDRFDADRNVTITSYGDVINYFELNKLSKSSKNRDIKHMNNTGNFNFSNFTNIIQSLLLLKKQRVNNCNLFQIKDDNCQVQVPYNYLGNVVDLYAYKKFVDKSDVETITNYLKQKVSWSGKLETYTNQPIYKSFDIMHKGNKLDINTIEIEFVEGGDENSVTKYKFNIEELKALYMSLCNKDTVFEDTDFNYIINWLYKGE